MLFYDWKPHLLPFGRDGALKPKDHKGSLTDLINLLIKTVFVEQHLASPGSAYEEVRAEDKKKDWFGKMPAIFFGGGRIGGD